MDYSNLKIIFFGTPDFVTPVLEQLTKHHQIVGVVTAPDKPVGRHQTLNQTPIARFAQSKKIPIFKPEKLNDEILNLLKKLTPDLFVVASYGKIIPQNILDIPRFGALNIHPSLLPKYRGPSPIQEVLLNGDKISGVTIIKMDEKMDHGPIVTTKEISLSDKDTFATLSTNMFVLGAELLIVIIPDFIAGKVQLKKQKEELATFTKIITKENGFFDINNLPTNRQVLPFLKKLDRMIRAYYPWPTTWTRLRQDYGGQAIKGKIVKFLPGGLIQLEGKKPVQLEDFLRGYPNFPLKTSSLRQSD